MLTPASAAPRASGPASLHPIGGIDHLLAMVTVGLLAGIAGGWARWALPLGFVTEMLAGAGLALAGGSVPLVETLIAASVVVLGALAALRFGLPTAAILAIVAFFAVFHGFAHGQGAPAGGAILAISPASPSRPRCSTPRASASPGSRQVPCASPAPSR